MTYSDEDSLVLEVDVSDGKLIAERHDEICVYCMRREVPMVAKGGYILAICNEQ